MEKGTGRRKEERLAEARELEKRKLKKLESENSVWLNEKENLEASIKSKKSSFITKMKLQRRP